MTPRSFDLEGDPPTLTVEAANSKHRRRMCCRFTRSSSNWCGNGSREWSRTDKLFPKLDRRKTWLMVKNDLERPVGIPYVTNDPIADFHAAGRHTHITGTFCRSGATLPEAQKLARHSDIRMTMKYAHIGIEDQAKAVANLPTAALHGHCISGVSKRQPVAKRGTTTDLLRNTEKPLWKQGFRQRSSLGGNDFQSGG